MIEPAQPGLKKHRMTTSTVVFMIFCLCAAGAYGIEEMIPEAGPGLTGPYAKGTGRRRAPSSTPTSRTSSCVSCSPRPQPPRSRASRSAPSTSSLRVQSPQGQSPRRPTVGVRALGELFQERRDFSLHSISQNRRLTLSSPPASEDNGPGSITTLAHPIGSPHQTEGRNYRTCSSDRFLRCQRII